VYEERAANLYLSTQNHRNNIQVRIGSYISCHFI